MEQLGLRGGAAGSAGWSSWGWGRIRQVVELGTGLAEFCDTGHGTRDRFHDPPPPPQSNLKSTCLDPGRWRLVRCLFGVWLCRVSRGRGGSGGHPAAAVSDRPLRLGRP